MKADPNRPRQLLIERARVATNSDTDADLARHMKVTPQTFSQWRSGQVAMTDERVIQMAELAGDPPELWLLLMSFANAKTPKAQRAWGAAMLRLGAQLDGLGKMLALALLFALPHQVGADVGAQPHEMHYAKWRGLCRLLRALVHTLRGSTSTERQDDATALLA